MVELAELPLLRSSQADASHDFLQALLREQQSFTAVEQFSAWHVGAAHGPAERYRALLPTGAPGPGEQLAFEVNLDACSGCKACVTACHSLNGLGEDETWRRVGRLLGQDPPPHMPAAPAVQQHVTTSCHHCVEPGCLSGCPVQAYDKDPLTGIVRHLDDQCIGCQYCILMCPYEAPQYSPALGIVRKCDMCRQRLEVGEAPACVQGCPNQAIRIAIVKQEDARTLAASGVALADSPAPHWTTPTTRYHSGRTPELACVSPRGKRRFVAADAEMPQVGHTHMPLVVMLVLTQLSVGVLLMERLLAAMGGSAGWQGALLLVSAFAGVVGGNAALLHLGRPWGAWRAFLGLRTSWLSREIVVLGGYGATVSIAALLALLDWQPMASGAAWLALLLGVVGVACSAMIYVVTGRDYWNAWRTGGRFLATVLGLGTATTLLIVAAQGASGGVLSALALTVALISVFQFGMSEESRRLRASEDSLPMRRTSLLLRGPVAGTVRRQDACLLVGGMILPTALLLCLAEGDSASSPAVRTALAGVIFGLKLLGELLERSLFFKASAQPSMPGETR